MEEFLAKLVVFGVPAIGVVMAIAEGIKRMFNVGPQKMPFVAMGSGFAVGAILLVIDVFPQVEIYMYYLLGSVLLGAGAMGAYSGTKALRGYTAVPQDSIVKEPSGEVYRTPPEEGGGLTG